jgi:cytoskeletal protein RodZ
VSEDRETALASATLAFGRWLLQERELRGLERGEVARLTKLTPGVIEALESGDPERMPPRAYVFGYLRSYAGVVGLDPDDVVLRFQEVVSPEEAGLRSPRRVSLRLILAAAFLLLVLAMAVATLLGPPRSRRGEPAANPAREAPGDPVRPP